MYNTATYEEFYSNVIRSIGDFKLILKNIRHKKVAGFCASAKGISFLNYCGIGNDTIKMIADDTPYKQGKFTPGSLIPIVSAKKLKEFNPDYIVVFSWNFVNEIKKKTSWFTKRYIIPIPYARVE
jgi:ABC-type Fe3+-hydroxamate transport system substrate-binding protein